MAKACNQTQTKYDSGSVKQLLCHVGTVLSRRDIRSLWFRDLSRDWRLVFGFFKKACNLRFGHVSFTVDMNVIENRFDAVAAGWATCHVVDS